jgi:hypothetical protein
MMGINQILYLIAFILFVVAGLPIDKRGWQFEWMAFARWSSL